MVSYREGPTKIRPGGQWRDGGGWLRGNVKTKANCSELWGVKLLFLLAACFLVAVASLPASAQLYYLNLSAQHIYVPTRSVFVEQVLDARPGHPPLGIVHRGLNNLQRVVAFRQGLEPELKNWLGEQLPNRAGDRPVVLCIRQLRVGEVLGKFTEEAFADVVADVYARLPDGYYFVRTVTEKASTRDLDATSRHSPNVAQLLQSCIQQLDQVDWTKPAQQPALALAQLAGHVPPVAARPAILRAAAPQRGLYSSFAQFLNNQPDVSGEWWTDTIRSPMLGWEGTTELRLKTRRLKKDSTAVHGLWGFSDGHQAFIYHDKTYRPLTRYRDSFTFVGPAPVIAADANQRAVVAGFIGGAIGGVAVVSSDHDLHRPQAFGLDIRTGQAAALPPPDHAQATDTAFLYVYRPRGGAPGKQRLFLNDREVGQLGPGEFLELICPGGGRLARLSADMPGGPALLTIPNTALANYVKLLPSRTAAPWQWVPPREGEAEVDALEKPRK